jgi:hypothetical protein
MDICYINIKQNHCDCYLTRIMDVFYHTNHLTVSGLFVTTHTPRKRIMLVFTTHTTYQKQGCCYHKHQLRKP